MYQVYLMKGEYEPWWFFEDWKSLITEVETFTTFGEAVELYKSMWEKLAQEYPNTHTKHHFLTAFWSEEDSVYCESCEDDIQIYRGLLLLKDDKVIDIENSKVK